MLKDSVFEFDPDRWGIVQGKVSDEVAQRNSEILNRTIQLVHSMGIEIFKIGKMDAYFGVDNYPDNEVINLPSNFSLVTAQ